MHDQFEERFVRMNVFMDPVEFAVAHMAHQTDIDRAPDA
jgi:hypothetical protein